MSAGTDMAAEAAAQSVSDRLKGWLKEEFQPSRLGPSLAAGSVGAVLTVIESVSYAALIFSGVLAAHVTTGIAITLTTAAVSALIMALFSSYPGTMSVPQNKIAPILALVAGAIAVGMPEGSTDQQMLITVFAAIIFTTVLTGVFLALLGTFKLGSLIRFIPYPVIAGFLAGTGWLLLLGSIKAMTGIPVSFNTLATVIQPDVFIKWLPGLAFAVTAHAVLSRWKHYLVMPGLMLLMLAIFYAALALTGTSLHEAREAHWLLHASGGSDMYKFLTVDALLHANWLLILEQAGGMATVLLVAAVSVLLNSSALELASEHEMDLDRELKAAGAACIGSGAAGGMVGFTSLTISGLVLKMGARSRLTGLISAGVCAAVLLFGSSAISFFPEPLIGGLLMFLGIEFLTEWVYDSYKELPRSDFAIVVLILAVVGLFGFIHGVMMGVVAAIIMFVIKYSRIDVVKHAISGSHHRSNVDRPPKHKRILRKHGDRVFILKLQGFVFFGTANNLLNVVRGRANDSSLPLLRFLVFDLREVTGIDSSAIISLTKMRQLADRTGFNIALAHLSETIEKQMEQGGLFECESDCWQMFPDLDHAVEWCEDRVLETEGVDLSQTDHSLREHLEEHVPGILDYSKLERYLKRTEFDKDSYLVRQDEPSEEMYFIESGQVTVLIDLDNGEQVRLIKMGAGTVVGELGLYLNQPRTASVIADERTVAYTLTREALAEMMENNPKTAAAFHDFMVRLLAQRLINTDKTLKTLLD